MTKSRQEHAAREKEKTTPHRTAHMQCATSVPDDDSTHEHAQMTTRTRRRRPVGGPACALGTWRMLVRNRYPSAKDIEQCGRVIHVAALHAAYEQHQFQIFCAGNWERAQTTQHLNSCNHKKACLHWFDCT